MAAINDNPTFKIGDHVTIAGVWRQVKNPDRRCWQFWKPRTIAGGTPMTFVVTGTTYGTKADRDGGDGS